MNSLHWIAFAFFVVSVLLACANEWFEEEIAAFFYRYATIALIAAEVVRNLKGK